MFENLEKILKENYNIVFNNKKLLKEALTQANYVNENENFCGRDYQRLEFLGDAIMQQSTAVYLFKKYPKLDEGDLTEIRISMVQTKSFAMLAKEIQLNKYVLLGHGEEKSGGRDRETLLEDIWEAFIGALFLDQGNVKVMEFLSQVMFSKIEVGFYDQFRDFKSKLQEYLQRNGSIKIEYETINQKIIKNNEKIFTVNVKVNNNILASGIGKSTKEAEKDAARNAYKNIYNK